MILITLTKWTQLWRWPSFRHPALRSYYGVCLFIIITRFLSLRKFLHLPSHFLLPQFPAKDPHKKTFSRHPPPPPPPSHVLFFASTKRFFWAALYYFRLVVNRKHLQYTEFPLVGSISYCFLMDSCKAWGLSTRNSVYFLHSLNISASLLNIVAYVLRMFRI